MAAGPVNRALLESFFQSPGEIYDDAKTEGALDVLADQIDDNSVIFNADGSLYLPSSTISGVTGLNVYAQLVSLKQQIDSIVGSSIPSGSISTAMIVDLAVTTPKIADDAVTWDKQSFVRETAGVLEYSIDGSVWNPVAGVKSIQRGTTVVTGTNSTVDVDVTISSVNMSKTAVVTTTSIAKSSPSDSYEAEVYAQITSATNLRVTGVFSTSGAIAQSYTVAWQVIEYN